MNGCDNLYKTGCRAITPWRCLSFCLNKNHQPKTRSVDGPLVLKRDAMKSKALSAFNQQPCSIIYQPEKKQSNYLETWKSKVVKVHKVVKEGQRKENRNRFTGSKRKQQFLSKVYQKYSLLWIGTPLLSPLQVSLQTMSQTVCNCLMWFFWVSESINTFLMFYCLIQYMKQCYALCCVRFF